MEATPIQTFFLSSSEVQKVIYQKTFNRLKILDVISLILSVLGLIFIQIETDAYYEQIAYFGTYMQDGKEKTAIFYRNENEDYSNFSMRLIILISTLCLSTFEFGSKVICFKVGILIIRSFTFFFYLKITNKVEIKASLRKSGILTKLLLEICFNLLIAYPRANSSIDIGQEIYHYSLSYDQIMSLIDVGRLYILARIWGTYSKFNQNKYQTILELCNSQGGINFAIKSEFYDNPFLVVGSYLTLGILTLGFCIRTCERSYSYISQLDWDYVWNAFWMVIIIMTTVGYGDFYAKTLFGRLFVFITCCLGPFLISLINVTIKTVTSFTKEEQRAYEKIKNRYNERQLYNVASDCIKFSIKYYCHVNLKLKSSRNRRIRIIFSDTFGKFKKSLLDFHKLRMIVNQQVFNKSIMDGLKIYSEKNDVDLENMILNFSKTLNIINARTEILQSNQSNIVYKIHEISSLYQQSMRRLQISSEKWLLSESEIDSNPDSLPLSSFLSNKNIKSFIIKKGSDMQSVLSSNINEFHGRKRRNEGDKSTIIGFNDMVKQLKKQVKPKNIKLDEADTTSETFENQKNDMECPTPTINSPTHSPHSLKARRQTVRKNTIRPLRSGGSGDGKKKSTFMKNENSTSNTTIDQKMIIENENFKNEDEEEEEEREAKVKFEKKIVLPPNNEEDEKMLGKKRKKDFNLSLFPIASKYENDSQSPFYVRSQSIKEIKEIKPIRKISEFTETNEITKTKEIREIKEIKEIMEITPIPIEGTELIKENQEINMTVDEISNLAKKVNYPSRLSNILAEMSSSTFSTKEKKTNKPKSFEYKKEMVFKNTSLKSEGTLTSRKLLEDHIFITDLMPNMRNYEKRELSLHITENSEKKDSESNDLS